MLEQVKQKSILIYFSIKVIVKRRLVTDVIKHQKFII